jgi:H+-transporting ATPase
MIPGESTDAQRGLTTKDVEARLLEYGPNRIAEEHSNLWLSFLRKFWAPVPWMLEAAIILQLVLGKSTEAIIVAALLVFNAILSFSQEGRARQALTLLRSRMDVQARVLRDGLWQIVPARNLVPGDVVHLRMGDLSPADIALFDGSLQLNQSALTGESNPIECGPGGSCYAGTIVERGEATGQVTNTGNRTLYGKTAELVQAARVKSHLENIIFSIVRYLVAFDCVLAFALLVYAYKTGMPWHDTLSFVLILLVAAVPAALPATFTLATALGAIDLANRGVLVTRLSSIEEAAAMDVLACDKTGTLTENRMTLAAVHPYGGRDENEVLRFAALASDEASQDPIDSAILRAAAMRSLLSGSSKRLRFEPFDPETKRTEAEVEVFGKTLRAVKGAPNAVASLDASAPNLAVDVERLAEKGYRVLAVASGSGDELKLAGLLALEDPPRQDSHSIIKKLRDLGIRILMVTGDNVITAKAVAAQVGIGNRVCSSEVLRQEAGGIEDCDVVARVLPEEKFCLVRKLQDAGHITGMTGDGVNDAPALRQAQAGFAMSSATDVAKAAASLILTQPGLGGVVAAVEASRAIYQRMLTYTLNKIMKTLEISLFLTLGVMWTGNFVITQLLIVLLLFSNDFVTMSIATDRVAFSSKPDRWNVRTLVLTSLVLAGFVLVLLFAVFLAARHRLGLSLPQLQTVTFLMLVFTGQGNIYLVRERGHFWQSRPGRWLIVGSVLDVLAVLVLATRGILMAPIDPFLAGGLLALVLASLAAIDLVKIRIFQWAGVR